jgi:cytochrome c biogenesis protein CcdA
MIAFAFLAGLVSVLSPCVLPLLPIVLATAAGAHRLGPVALAIGVAISFVAVGMFVATLGFAAGIDGAAFRMLGAAILVLLGATLLIPRLSAAVAVAAGPFSGAVDKLFGGISTAGLGGQFSLGLLLGLVWSPCVGPTLGAASVLAAQGKDLWHVAGTMAAFGVGAAIPLLVLGVLSREAMLAWRSRLLSTGQTGKFALGGTLLILGVLIATGLDKTLEAAVVAASPTWLADITTRF